MVAYFLDQQVFELAYLLGPAAITSIGPLPFASPPPCWRFAWPPPSHRTPLGTLQCLPLALILSGNIW